MTAVAAHSTPSQVTQESSSAAAAANPDVDAQYAPQANATKGGGKPPQAEPYGLAQEAVDCLQCLFWPV